MGLKAPVPTRRLRSPRFTLCCSRSTRTWRKITSPSAPSTRKSRLSRARSGYARSQCNLCAAALKAASATNLMCPVPKLNSPRLKLRPRHSPSAALSWKMRWPFSSVKILRRSISPLPRARTARFGIRCRQPFRLVCLPICWSAAPMSPSPSGNSPPRTPASAWRRQRSSLRFT